MKNFIIALMFSTIIFAQNDKPSYKIRTEFTRQNSARSLSVKVMNENGELKYVVHKQLKSKESAPNAVILKNGGIVLIDVLEGTAEFYDSNGSKIKTVGLFDNLPFVYERKVITDAEDGLVAFLISQIEESNSVIEIFDNNGNEIYRFEAKGENGSGIEISPSGKLLAVSTYDWKGEKLKCSTRILDLEGNLFFEFSEKFDTGMFNSDDEYFLGYDKHKMFLAKLREKKLEWVREFPEREYILTAAFAPGGKEIVSVSATKTELKKGKWYNKIAVVRKIDFDGTDKVLTVLNDKEFSNVELIQANNKIKAVFDGEEIIVE